METLLKLKESYKRLRVGSHVGRALIKSGRLRVIKLGPRTYRVSASEIDRFLSEAPVVDFKSKAANDN